MKFDNRVKSLKLKNLYLYRTVANKDRFVLQIDKKNKIFTYIFDPNLFFFFTDYFFVVFENL